MMPQRIICSGCGYVFYEGNAVKPPSDVIKEYGGKCPKCGKNLKFTVDSVEVKGYQRR